MMEKGKNERRKNKSRLKTTRPGPGSGQDESNDGVEEIFGVHVISDEDIENHFGVSQEDASAASSDKKTKIE
jgi:hypothetical protein